jgi:hypothetical protein
VRNPLGHLAGQGLLLFLVLSKGTLDIGGTATVDDSLAAGVTWW